MRVREHHDGARAYFVRIRVGVWHGLGGSCYRSSMLAFIAFITLTCAWPGVVNSVQVLVRTKIRS